MTLKDAMEVLVYNVFVLIRDEETNEIICLAYSNTIKSDERMKPYMKMQVFQIFPIDSGTLRITLTH